MQNAKAVLEVIRDRGKRGLPLENVYRQLYNQDLYLVAYGRLYSNAGAMTPGTTAETVDGMSLGKIRRIIELLRQEKYRWIPVRRVYIPKKSGKMRPLGLPTWSDKLLQEVLRLLLEAYYDPQFSSASHGFRPNHGCHTALSDVKHRWTGTKWFIEGDIAQCFDRLDHEVLMSILSEKLHDNRLLRLIKALLQAGYLEHWRYGATLSGSPQGGVISPLLSNIYLDKLDQFVEQVLQKQYTQGERRRDDSRYISLADKVKYRRRKGKFQEAAVLRKQMRRYPSLDPYDPTYRRLRYVRYADDFLLGFAGPMAEAEDIKRRLKEFLGDSLKLELSEEKTLVTNASTEAARFLGYELIAQRGDDQLDRNGRRTVNGVIGLRVPASVIDAKCARFLKNGSISHRPELQADEDFSIIERYQSEYRGVAQYYLLAQNVAWLWRLNWVMQGSLLMTLAAKHKSTMSKMKRKFQSTVETPYGTMKCLKAVMQREGKEPLVTRFGGIPLRRKDGVVLNDLTDRHFIIERNEVVRRLLANHCELCGSTKDCEVHHVRKLSDVKYREGQDIPWKAHMASRQRKTLVVCSDCHVAIHAGRPTKQKGDPV